MTKSSEVLRLAAESRFEGAFFPIDIHAKTIGEFVKANEYGEMCGYFEFETEGREHEVIILCLASAIAESEGD